LKEFLVSRLKRAQVVFLLLGQTLEDRATPFVPREARRPGVEVEAAPLGGNGDAQGVPGEQELGVAFRHSE
jgi:hypothetical protein